VEYSGDIEKIAFPTSNLLTIMEHYASAQLTLTITGAEGPCGISGSDDVDYLVIIMPMKILDDINFSEEQV
jgi:DNA polymerase-3 subunit beta